MRFVLHSFFSVMLAALVAGLGVAYFTEFTHRARLQEMATRPCETGASSVRPECPEPSVVAEDSRPGPLPPLVLPQINALEIGPLPDLAEPEVVEAAAPAEPVEMPTGAARVQEPVAVLSTVEPSPLSPVTSTPPMPAFQEVIATPDPAKSFTPLPSAAVSAPESPAIVPSFTAPVTAPPSLAQPTPSASPGGVTPQAKSPPERRAPVRPARRAERRPVVEDIIQPEFDSAPVRGTTRVSPQPPRAVTSAPLLLPGAVEATNTPRE